jgi:hypothetical protein
MYVINFPFDNNIKKILSSKIIVKSSLNENDKLISLNYDEYKNKQSIFKNDNVDILNNKSKFAEFIIQKIFQKQFIIIMMTLHILIVIIQ